MRPNCCGMWKLLDIEEAFESGEATQATKEFQNLWPEAKKVTPDRLMYL